MKRSIVVGISILVIGGIALGLFLNPQLAAGIKKRIFGDDPDLPVSVNPKGIKEANAEEEEEGVDKEAYLLSRAENIGYYRGVEKDKPFDPQLRIAAIREEDARAARLANLPGPTPVWQEIGPNPQPEGQTINVTTPVSGRVSAIAVHPANANIVYVGTAQGGLFRTTDGGATWTPLMDSALSLAIGAVAIAPTDPDTVYVGTGEPGFAQDTFFGVGIYRITNASGVSPTLSGPFGSAEMSGRAVSEIVVDPANAANIFATTTSGVGGDGAGAPSPPARGLFRSTNATGASPVFTKLPVVTAGEDFNMTDLAIDPANGNRLLVAVIGGAGQSGVWLSTNALGAATFTRQLAIAGTTPSTARTELAIANIAGTVTVFAATGAPGTLFRSTDGGVNWTTPGGGSGFCGSQCFYDIAVAVDPTNTGKVYLGGGTGANTFLFSTNGGTSFTSSTTGLHTDTQALAVAPSFPATVYFGSDGGIWKSTNSGASWTSLNNATFRATQFESIAVHPTDPNFSIGGTQDNGTMLYDTAGNWKLAQGGDGGFSLIDQNASGTVLVNAYSTFFNSASSQKGYLSYTIQNGTPVNSAFRGCAGATANGIPCGGAVLFYAPLEQGPGNPNTTYYGANVLFRSADGGVNHTAASQDFVNPISAIGISPQNDSVRIVGTNNGRIFGTATGSATMTDLDPSNVIPDNFVGRAVIDPNNVDTAYVTLAAFGVTNVWKTTNFSSFAGSGSLAPAWTAAATGLPQVPVTAFLVDRTDSNFLYAGTDIGVYYSSDAGASWNPLGTGLPRVAVFDLAQTADNLLRIATHGRGFWQISVPSQPVRLAARTATLLSESFTPANGVIDPGETVTVAFPALNQGFVDTVNDVGTLQNTGGVTLAGAAQNYGVVGTSTPTAKTFTFKASPSLVCGTPVTATIRHQDGATDLGSLTYRLPTGTPAGAATTSYTGPPVGPADNDPTGIDIVLPVSGFASRISDVNFRLDALAGCDATIGNTNASVTHTFVSDLQFTLRSPAGTTVQLMLNRGSVGVNFCTITLDDESANPLSGMLATGGVSGDFRPESPLSAFDGEDPNGNWTLHVADIFAGDTGTVNRFSLVINGSVCALSPTAAGVTVAGRVSTAGGGLANAIVYLTDASGSTRSRRTNSFGYYSFDNLRAGQTVTVTVVSKRFTFAPRVVDVDDNIADLDFYAAAW
ncbi:MAG: proprotein convertase P-domain-containing protein [Acidobacteria bacterium]|nr:proprotein convertase P-domain-containing protein [Acidobacteriota bacterium]